MRNENRAVFDRASERCDLTFKLQLAPTISTAENDGTSAEEARPNSIFGKVIMFAWKKLRQRRNRNALLELTDDQLKDIGVSRSQAYADHSSYRRNACHGVERKCL